VRLGEKGGHDIRLFVSVPSLNSCIYLSNRHAESATPRASPIAVTFTGISLHVYVLFLLSQ
jgi:hypothetical protein